MENLNLKNFYPRNVFYGGKLSSVEEVWIIKINGNKDVLSYDTVYNGGNGIECVIGTIEERLNHLY